jgi:hypothetical protein
MKRAILSTLVLSIAVALPATAHADGLPVAGVDGGDGVVSQDGASRYVTFTGRSSTTVARLRTKDGKVSRFRSVPGAFSVPVVALDGTGSGLSADGRTLVLIRPRAGMAQKRTHLMVLDAARFKVQRRVTLRGDFSFDAISPDGSTLYLVNYLSLSRRNFDPTNYKVRAFDTASGRLLPKPIVDPHEPDERMAGFPVSRTMSPDGRWAYTLYGGGDHPFIHALDTTGRTARCVDLDALTTREDLFQMRLQLGAGGKQLAVAHNRKPVVLVNTTSFKVSEPRATRPPATTAPGDGGGRIWPFPLALAILVLLAASARPLARAVRPR